MLAEVYIQQDARYCFPTELHCPKESLRHFSSPVGLILMMATETNDSVVAHSTIALLQERFKQLQQLKDMRVKRDLLKSSEKDPECSIDSTTISRETPNCTFQHGESSNSPSLLLSLWPDSTSDDSQCSRSEDSTSRKKRRIYSDLSSKCFYVNDGVDTSLHL
ncbi:hypothetical protein MLD38_040825 [Melastoma candidum]|nr:hypothetical protein MLD38_040825 [Melastoma candidum]